MNEPKEREAIEDDDGKKEGLVESKWPTQVTPEDKTPKLEERPKTEPKQMEFTKGAEDVISSSLTAVMVPESAPIEIRGEASTTNEKLLDDIDTCNVKSSRIMAVESKTTAVADQEDVVAMEAKGSGQIKEPKFQQDGQLDIVPVSKLVEQDESST